MKPTDEQIKGFWELHGWKQDSCRNWVYPPQYKNGHFSMYGIPPIDLNNLFQYAMPKLDQSYYYKALSSIFLKTEDPALTLFWAIYEVMKK